MLVKIHKGTRYVVAICDTELYGKKITENDREISLEGNFFKGEEKSSQEVIEIIKDMKLEDSSFNIVGKESVECALKAKIISKEGIIKIGDVPIALVLL